MVFETTVDLWKSADVLLEKTEIGCRESIDILMQTRNSIDTTAYLTTIDPIHQKTITDQVSAIDAQLIKELRRLRYIRKQRNKLRRNIERTKVRGIRKLFVR